MEMPQNPKTSKIHRMTQYKSAYAVIFWANNEINLFYKNDQIERNFCIKFKT